MAIAGAIATAKRRTRSATFTCRQVWGVSLLPTTLPRGAVTMVFTANNLSPVPDGQGGTFLVGTLELDITEATGVYQPFVGGHNKMVDILHRLADGTLVEHCFCIISH